MSDKVHDQADKQPRRLNFKTLDPALRRDDAPPSKYFAGPPPNGKTANQRIAELAKPSHAKAKHAPATQHRCGHPLEEGRKPKKRCTACVASTQAEEAKAHAAASTRGRLPDGSRFDVQWDAVKEHWTGTLVVPGDLTPCGTIFSARARGVFPLLAKLDKLYRKGAVAR